MVITEKRTTGDRGEEFVVSFLMKHGYSILERNHWRKWGEIDIVAKNIKDNHLHFIEVKTVVRDLDKNLDRSADDFLPIDNMTVGKRKKFCRIIESYIMENELGDSDWQADVALVYLDRNSDRFEIELLEDVEL